ncbi:hypothetical protein DL93DRAFT_2090798 [Clavulina sp. PMI_390]|nr:hypothetical protein DL93DRAFT_2090798 [Clavulina sp. PMI_390]
MESSQPIRPASTNSHPFLDEIEGLRWSSFWGLERWKPPSSRSGLIIHMTRQALGNTSHLISLSTTAAPSWSAQLIDAFLPRNESDYSRAALVDSVGGGILILDIPGIFNITEEESMDVHFFPFAENGSFGQPIEREHRLEFPYTANPDSLCFVSGRAIMKDQFRGPEWNSQVVGIICFDLET